MDCSMPNFPVFHCLLEFAQNPVHWVNAIQPSHPLFPLLQPSIFPSIRVFSNELTLHIRWSKYWSFSFSISPSTEYLGLTSFTIDWLTGLISLLSKHDLIYHDLIVHFFIALNNIPLSRDSSVYYIFTYWLRDILVASKFRHWQIELL